MFIFRKKHQANASANGCCDQSNWNVYYHIMHLLGLIEGLKDSVNTDYVHVEKVTPQLCP